MTNSVVARCLRVTAVVVAGLAISTSLVSCSEKSEQSHPAALAALTGTIVLPGELETAKFSEITSCMNAAGFQYQPPNFSSAESDQANLMGVAGLFDDPSDAAKSGYPSSLKARTNSDQVDVEDSMAPADRVKYELALNGPANGATVQATVIGGSVIEMKSGGCYGSATHDVYGSIENYLELTSLYNASRSPIIGLDISNRQDIRDAYHDYGQCMHQQGYDFESIRATQDFAAQQFGKSRAFGSTPSTAESALASTDATCQQKARIRQVNNDAYLSVSADWINSHETDLLRLVDLKNLALANAKKILEG